MITDEHAEHLRLWADALTSGRYQQGRSTLAHRDEDTGETRYCCLGVACEIAREHGVPITVTARPPKGIRSFRPDHLVILYDDNAISMPEPVARWYGFSQGYGNPLLQDQAGTTLPASDWNDGREATFPEIAEMIIRLVEEGTAQ
jgi:hypothetical protein